LRGQGANTRVHNCLKTLDVKVDAAATRYHIAYQSLSALSASVGLIGWRDKLCPLADEDICTLTDAFDLRPGEGRCRVSWIWQMCGYNEQATENEGDDGFQEGEHLPVTTLVLSLPCISHSCGMVQGMHTRTPLGRGSQVTVQRTTAYITVPRVACKLVDGPC